MLCAAVRENCSDKQEEDSFIVHSASLMDFKADFVIKILTTITSRSSQMRGTFTAAPHTEFTDTYSHQCHHLMLLQNK